MAIRVACKDESLLLNDLCSVRETLLSLAHRLDEISDVLVELDEGKYSLCEPFTLSAATDLDLKKLRIRFCAKDGAKVEINSLKPLYGSAFEKVEGKPYYVYRFSADEEGKYPVFRCLYHGGSRMKFSASPVYRNPFARSPEEIRGEKEIKGLYVPYAIAEKLSTVTLENVEVFMYVQWEYLVVRAKGVDLSDTIEKDGERYALVTFIDEEFKRCYVSGVHSLNNTGNRPTFFQNTVAFLEKGSFAYIHSKGELYVYPDDDMDIEEAEFFHPSFDKLFILDGLIGTSFEGISFTGAGATFFSHASYIAPLSNVIRKLPHAAILGKNMRELSVDKCRFHGLGCNGVQLNGRTVTVKITNSEFTDVGGFGVVIGGYEGGTWQLPNPTTASEEEMKRFFSTATYDAYIENNYFEHIGYDYPNSAAIYFGSVDGAKILHNTVIDCAYSGISLGWGWQAFFVPGELFNLRAVEIAYNRVHDFMQLLRDGGAIYTYGANSITSHASRFNATHHNYASLSDAGDKDKRGYYLDCSTSNWDVYDNVIDNCFIPYFAQYHVKHENPHHVRLDRNYSTTPISERNHAPERDVLVSDAFVVEGKIEELFEVYPAAKAICDGAGCAPVSKYE